MAKEKAPEGGQVCGDCKGTGREKRVAARGILKRKNFPIDAVQSVGICGGCSGTGMRAGWTQ